jgi:hypothetical protein
VEISAQGLANDLAGGGVIGLGACFHRRPKFGVKANRDDLRRARTHEWPTASGPWRSNVVASLGLGRHLLDIGVGDWLASRRSNDATGLVLGHGRVSFADQRWVSARSIVLHNRHPGGKLATLQP